jgi:hypothetical protein
MDERKTLLRRIRKAQRRIVAGYVPPKGQESEVDRHVRLERELERVLGLHPTKETYEPTETHPEEAEGR